METENEQGTQSPRIERPPTVPPAETPDSIAIRRALMRLLGKRIRKLVALLAEVRTDASPKTVHDVRVWSRRLQQAVSAFFPRPRSGKVRRLRRMPRRIRRALGEWRNCDVVLGMVARQERRSRNGAKQQAWAFAREYVIEKRSKQAARAVKKLLRQDVENYFALAHSLLAQAPDESAEKLMERLFGSVQRARTRWQSVLSRAQESRAAADLHALRIATKALRYRTELIYDLDHKQYKAQLKWLEELQDALGVWHDRQMFDEAVAECVARPDILLNELRSVRILLAELEKDRGRQAEAVTEIFRLASEHPATRETGSWTETDSLLTPHSSPLD